VSLSDFGLFKEFLLEELRVPQSARQRILGLDPSLLYDELAHDGVKSDTVARLIAQFSHLSYVPVIDPDIVDLGMLPEAFCRANLVVALKEGPEGQTFVLSNPFNWECIEALRKYSRRRDITFVITAPETISSLLEQGETPAERKSGVLDGGIRMGEAAESKTYVVSKEAIETRPVVHITNTLLQSAVRERASDIHIEPKENNAVVRFRIDGDMRDMFSFSNTTGMMVITRLKALAELDIAERRKPQDGALEAIIDKRRFKLRLATTSTPNGESLVMRLLEPNAKQKELQELGMTAGQVETMLDFTRRTQGLVLIVGPTGSGKTTTVYSLLSKVDCTKRSLISVEDPVEYRIAFANQQQVNEKMGVSFDTVLKSSVRQDPDILFIGEVRDEYSARIAIDFASTGHLTVSTLHTSNAITALFRLERLGATRAQMADSVVAIVAQRLLKRLCPDCKKIVPISDDERKMLSPFTRDLPAEVAHPVGCPTCNGIGYLGREGIYEIIKFDPEVGAMVRSDETTEAIRGYISQRGDYLISHHAIEKLRALLFSPKDVYGSVLAEELAFAARQRDSSEAKVVPGQDEIPEELSILVVEDDKDTQKLLARILENAGYKVTLADDGVEGLIQLSTKQFRLIISDIGMPNLDGFKFMEIKSQKKIETPLIFLTAQGTEENEIKALTLGAFDFVKKPIQKDLLLLRVRKVLQGA
jgi:type IV pilus assembly protein PilB